LAGTALDGDFLLFQGDAARAGAALKPLISFA
jgi:hypothetical protein